MDKGTLLFLITDLCVLLMGAVAKTVLFVRAARRRSVLRWLYFTKFDIVNAPTESVRKSRQTQNKLSAALLVFVVLSAVAFLLISL